MLEATGAAAVGDRSAPQTQPGELLEPDHVVLAAGDPTDLGLLQRALLDT